MVETLRAVVGPRQRLTGMDFCFAMVLSLVVSVLFGQEIGTGGVEGSDTELVALQKIQDDYREHLAKRERIFESYRAVEATLKETEGDFQRIANESIRNQLLAMQSSFQSRQLGSALQGLSIRNSEISSGRSRSLTRDQVTQLQKRLVKEKSHADLKTSIKMEELRQLDSASQAIVQRRLKSLQSGAELEQEWGQWQQDWVRFFERYWPHMDPEQRFTDREIEDRLRIFKAADREDFASMIARALLMERKGHAEDGLIELDRVLEAGTALDTTACFAKALLLFSIDRSKEAKSVYQRGMKEKDRSPYVAWLRARIAIQQKQWALAENEWKSLVTIPEFEVSSRRSLALLHYTRISKSPVEGRKSLKEAQEAFDLESTHDWYSHLVLGLAAYGVADRSLAKEQIEMAWDQSTGENRELCEGVREAMENDRLYVWEFGRGEKKVD